MQIKLRKSWGEIIGEIMPIVLGLSALYVIVLNLEMFFNISAAIPIDEHTSNVIYNILRISIILEAVRRYFNDVYVFDDHKLTYYKGCLSINYRVITVKYSDIKEMRVEQHIFGRMLGFGSVKVGTASTSDYEAILKGINQAEKVVDWVNERRTEIDRERAKRKAAREKAERERKVEEEEEGRLAAAEAIKPESEIEASIQLDSGEDRPVVNIDQESRPEREEKESPAEGVEKEVDQVLRQKERELALRQRIQERLRQAQEERKRFQERMENDYVKKVEDDRQVRKAGAHDVGENRSSSVDKSRDEAEELRKQLRDKIAKAAAAHRRRMQESEDPEYQAADAPEVEEKREERVSTVKRKRRPRKRVAERQERSTESLHEERDSGGREKSRFSLEKKGGGSRKEIRSEYPVAGESEVDKRRVRKSADEEGSVDRSEAKRKRRVRRRKPRTEEAPLKERIEKESSSPERKKRAPRKRKRKPTSAAARSGSSEARRPESRGEL